MDKRLPASCVLALFVFACTLQAQPELKGPPSRSELPGLSTFKAEALCRMAGPNRIVILLDTNGDGTIDRGYSLRSEEAVMPFAAIRIAPAHIEASPESVRVIGDQKVIELRAIDSQTAIPVPQGWEHHRFVGYELVGNRGETGVRIRPDRGAIANSNCWADGEGCNPYDGDQEAGGGGTGTRYPSCDNGGYGSSSCSVTTGSTACSVTCSSGYFACCNNGSPVTLPVCRCVKY